MEIAEACVLVPPLCRDQQAHLVAFETAALGRTGRLERPRPFEVELGPLHTFTSQRSACAR